MYASHSAWCYHIFDVCIEKKQQPRRVYNNFRKYNNEFQLAILPRMIEKVSETNL